MKLPHFGRACDIVPTRARISLAQSCSRKGFSMRIVAFCLAVVMALFTGLVAAQEATGPRQVVEAIFAGYQPGQPKGDPSSHYSSRLRTLNEEAQAQAVLVSDAAMAGDAFAPAPVFDPFVPDAGVLLYDLVIDDAVVHGDRAVVSVRYSNFDAPHLISISLVREEDSWKVDDVASFANDEPWLLSWALASDPYLN
jgi:hypothetical protein